MGTKVRLPVLDAGKLEIREYDLPDAATRGALATPAQVLASHYTAIAIHSDKAGAYMRVLGQPHAVLPYAYFRFRDVEFFATEAGYSTALRRFIELLDLAALVGRVQGLEA